MRSRCAAYTWTESTRPRAQLLHVLELLGGAVGAEPSLGQLWTERLQVHTRRCDGGGGGHCCGSWLGYETRRCRSCGLFLAR